MMCRGIIVMTLSVPCVMSMIVMSIIAMMIDSNYSRMWPRENSMGMSTAFYYTWQQTGLLGKQATQSGLLQDLCGIVYKECLMCMCCGTTSHPTGMHISKKTCYVKALL